MGFGLSGAALLGDPVVELGARRAASDVGERLVRMVGRVSSPRFVDRRKELSAIEAALARTRDGWGSVVFVGGEAGIGKSRLISEVAGRAERDGMTVVIGECLPLGDGELPYAPVVGALRSLVAQREGSELETMLGSVRRGAVGLAAGAGVRPRWCDEPADAGGIAGALVRAVAGAAGLHRTSCDRWCSSWRTFSGPIDPRATSSRS